MCNFIRLEIKPCVFESRIRDMEAEFITDLISWLFLDDFLFLVSRLALDFWWYFTGPGAKSQN